MNSFKKPVEIFPNGYLTREGQPIGRLEIGGGLNKLLFESEKGELSTPTLEIRGGQRVNIVNPPSIYDVKVSDFLIAINNLGVAPILRLPKAKNAYRQTYVITDAFGSAAATTITINAREGDVINSESTILINTNFGHIKIYASGSSTWGIIT